jgi:very-short-patch-repair endonuclease
MATQIEPKRAWRLARRQHAVLTREQLLALGFSPQAIKHRIRTGRLHPKWRGVYAVGRPELTREGVWMAAVLACGPRAVLSHASAAALWQLRPDDRARLEVSVPRPATRRRAGIVVHRDTFVAADATRHRGIAVTSPVRTLIDLSAELTTDQLEAAVNEADKHRLVNPEALRQSLEGRRGAAKLRRLLDRRTFVLTETALERHFLPIARRAGLPKPQTAARVNGFKVDFYWPQLGLVVETDGLTYHRTPAQQAADRIRDQTHTAAGLTPLRFTHGQVAFDKEHVRATLAAVAARCAARAGTSRAGAV